MGNALVLKAFGGVEAAKKYAAAAYAVISTIGMGNDGKPILRLTEDGDWIFGQDETPLHKTDLLAINPASFRHGYIAFDDKGVAFDVHGDPAEILQPIVQPLPYRDDLPELEEPRGKRSKRVPKWQDQLALDLIVVDGKNKGAEMVYKPTSVGGLRMCAKIIGEVARRLEADELEIVPLVELFSSSYFNRTWNKDVAVPEHAIIEWREFDDAEFVATAPAKAKSNGKGAEKVDPKEKTRRGDDVDTRRSSRRRDDDEDQAPRSRRGAPREDEVDDQDEDGEPRRAKRERPARDDGERPARRAARDEEPAPRRGRSVDDDAGEVEEDEAPRRSRRGRDEEPAESRSRRGRDDDADDAKPAARARRGRDEAEEEVEERAAPRRARRDDDEDDRAAGPRGRKAASGGRRR
jgi:hypothetical protein